jgi:hypothetical protein
MRNVKAIFVAIVSLVGCAVILIGRRVSHRTRPTKSAAGALDALARHTRKGVDEAIRQAHKQILRTHQGQRARRLNGDVDCIAMRSKRRLDAAFRLLQLRLSPKKAAVSKR